MPSFRRQALPLLLALTLAACVGDGDTPPPEAGTDGLASLQRQLAEQAEAAHDLPTAVTHYRRLVAAHPQDVAAAAGLARTLRHAGQIADARQSVETALHRLGPLRPLRLEQAKLMIAVEALDQAESLLGDLITADGNDWEAPSLLGIVKDRRGDLAAAQAAYRRSLALAPDKAQTINNLALSLAMSGQLLEAQDLLEGLVLRPRAPLNASQNLAMLYALQGRMDKAEALVRANLPPEAVDPMLKSLRDLKTVPKAGL